MKKISCLVAHVKLHMTSICISMRDSFTIGYFKESRGFMNAYINYPDKMSNLNESEDEFTVKAPKGWDVTYLRVGDTITPDMWNKREIKQVTSDVSFDEPLKIKWIGTDGFDGVIEFEGYDSDYLNVEFIFNHREIFFLFKQNRNS